MNAPATWSLALAVSILTHVSAAALVASMLHPDPIADQPPPKSELHIETQEVAHSQATAEQPDAPQAETTSAKGAMATEGLVPQSHATAQAPKQETLAAAKPNEPAVKAAAAPAQKLATAAPPPATKAADLAAQKLITTLSAAQKLAAAASPEPVVAQSPQATTIAPAKPPATTAVAAVARPADKLQPATEVSAKVAEATAPTTALTATIAPTTAAAPQTLTAEPLPVAKDTAQPLATATPDAPVIAQSTPDSPQATEAAPTLQLAAAAPADGDHMTAALAWAGDDAQIDPVSLKAIQSFMQPGDTAAQSDETHDALSSILSSVPCARLQAEFNPATGSLDLRGHVPDAALKGPVLAALQAQLGSGIKVNDAMLILPRPQCGALSGIADVGLPQSQDQNTNPKLIGADAQARAYDYKKGQTMVLDLAAPDYDAYVYVDFFDADGNVIHLVPNDTVPLKLRPAKSTLRVGAPDADEPFLHITIGPPYGQEIAAAFAASAPLYDGTRPLSEPAGPYLDWLKIQVSEARARDPAFKGEWVYFFVSTTEN
ncbi:MAG: DUF4384 domain-containing protein [bacterium]